MTLRAANALFHYFLQAPVAFQAAILPPLHEDGDDAGVLPDWSVSLGAHAAVGQNLGDGVLRSRAFLRFIGFAEGADVVLRVIIADELQHCGDAFEVRTSDGKGKGVSVRV